MPDIGLLVLRLGVGASMMIFHGYGKMFGGADKWKDYGASMANFGINFWPSFWGFMAGFSEFFASLFLMLGLFFRPATAMLAFTMFVAFIVHMNMPSDSPMAGIKGASHALELLAVYAALFLTGPGKYALVLRRDA